jgi:pyridoxine 5-phosphate synthase
VPENRREITTEGGLNLSSHDGQPDPRLREAVGDLQAVGIRISLFIDPEPAAIDAARALNVEAIEFHTGEYANAPHAAARKQIERLERAADHGKRLGLAIHAGHGLTYNNVTPVAAIRELEELNIGHSVVSRSILTGMETAVREMRELVDKARLTKPM